MIVAVAIRFNELICHMPPPCRHSDVIKGCADAKMPLPIVGEQGFMTSSGKFLDRQEAALHAVTHDQVPRAKIHSNGKLYSEDLW